ncbi:MAG: hypothetical protein QM808_12295 [Steroidobacteraceae bacterium]
MKKNLTILSVTLLCMTGKAALAECAYPKAPDGVASVSTATQADMITAMSAFKQYNTDVDAYVACLDAETADKIKEAGAAGAIMQIKAMQAKKKSAATDERQAKIDAFNKTVREFKAKG